MRSFDTIRFLEDYGIEYVTSGKSVSRKYAGVQCPFCQDSGHHLGIHKTNGFSTCWLCGKHGLYNVVKELTGENPANIVEQYSTLLYSNVQEFTPTTRPGKIEVPGRRQFSDIHHKYLNDRGYDSQYIYHKYDVRATFPTDPVPYDKWLYRLVFPIKYNNKIVSYQGRTVVDSIPKYLTCMPEKEIMFHKDTLFNIDNCQGDSILVVEGVFDVIRFGDNCACTFGTQVSQSQLNLLASRFKRVFFLYDPEQEAEKKAKTALTSLSSCGMLTERVTLEEGTDPGDLTNEEALYIKKELNLV